MRFLDFPESIQHLALFVDSPAGAVLLWVSLAQILSVVFLHIRSLNGSRFVRVVVTGSLLILPLITIGCLYVAGLPKA
ncbi:hypothetical protein [Aquabacterium sp.]|uniref:hypothetical protein n=1 Tax=Aquabacterium sp. TaxID=1872578 RepID=UPI0035AF92CE